MGRKDAREELFKVLFEAEMKSEEPISIYEGKNFEFSKNDDNFLVEYCKGMEDRKDEVDDLINSKMKNWKVNRLGNVEKILLRIATYEILEDKVTYEIAINEAIEIAKKYGDVKSAKFINGVLANIID
ncbi:MAG: transcription antitermination factor NusB [Fusobacteriota bacterium]